MNKEIIPLEERTVRSADEILETENVYAFSNSYQKKNRQLEMLKHRYEMLRRDFENLKDRHNSLKHKIKNIKDATMTKKTDDEMRGYGNYERHCIEKIEDILRGT